MPRNPAEPIPSVLDMPLSALKVYSRTLGSPGLGATNAVSASQASTAPIDQTASITNPDVPRNITATSGGTAANITAQAVTINGTDIEDNPLSETLPAFTAGSATTVVGSKAFKTVTEIICPTIGASTTLAVGTGAKLGLPRRIGRDTVLNAYLNNVRESTRPTVAFDATNIFNNTATLNSALNGNGVVVDFYEP
jgi:hypothetical protein